MNQYLPAIVSVAFLLTASPTELRATHQYTPSSFSFFPRITLQFNDQLNIGHSVRVVFW